MRLRPRWLNTAVAVANETFCAAQKLCYQYSPMNARPANAYFWYYFPKPPAEEGMRSP